MLLAALPQAGADARQEAASPWRALPVPALSAEPIALPILPRLLEGRHVLLPGQSLEDPRSTTGVRLPLPALLSLLQEDGVRRKQPVRIEPGAPPLLARGELAALEAARSLLEGLDREARGLEIVVSAWLTSGAADLGTHPARQVFEAAVASTPPLGSARLRSGDSVAFGARTTRGFVAGYTVEIASGSAIAGPAIGQVLTGRTLHLRACRVRAGKAIALEGFLDLSELSELESFDPHTPDLGLLQQPVVDSVQIAFAGLVDAGGVLAVALAGTPLTETDSTLWIEAGGGEASAARDGAARLPGAWRVLDLAWLEQSPTGLPLPGPGAGCAPGLLRVDVEPPASGLSAASLAQAADTARGAGARPGRTPIVWTPGLLLAPAEETALWNEVEALVSAAENDRLRGADLELRQGGLRVLLPVLEGVPARVLVGRERVVLSGYELQVAQDSWIPRPVVDLALDAALVQGRLDGGAWSGAGWCATSRVPLEIAREDVGLARLEVHERSFTSGSVRCTAGAEPVAVIEAIEGVQALRVGLRSR